MKFKTSIGFDEFSGSAGNVTAAKVKGRSYLKRKPIPFNPNTEAQQEIRNRFKLIAKAYKALAQEKKNLWDTNSKTALSRAVFGVRATLSGINLFQRVNQNLALVNVPIMDTPPTTSTEFPELKLIAVDGICRTNYTGSGEQGTTMGFPALIFKQITMPEQIAIIVRMSDVNVAGSKFIKSQTKIITVSPTLVQVGKDDSLNNLKEDITIIPLGNDWSKVFKKRASSNVNQMISVEVVSKEDGSMIKVLEYCGITPSFQYLRAVINESDNNKLESIS